MRMPEPAVQRTCSHCRKEMEEGVVRRLCSECEEELQAKAEPGETPSVPEDFESRFAALQGSGQPLPASERAFFEPRFGRDFSNVRLHSGPAAGELARSVHARAFTLGDSIVLGAGESGRRLLAHELTHVVQQRSAGESVQRFTTEDCSSDDQTRIQEAHDRGIAFLENAIRRLTADPVTAETQRLFANHFGAYAEWRRAIVVWHLRRTLELMRGDGLIYECETSCDPGEDAYTYWIFGDVHICPVFHQERLNDRAEALIHEIHHWDVLRGHLDLGYHGNNQDANTIWIVAVNNADSYSELCQDLYEQP